MKNKIMYKFILNAFLLFSTVNCFSQSLERTVIGSAGTTLTTPQVNLEFTVGEIAVSEISNGTTSLGQGFHQGNLAQVLGVPEQELLNLKFYPNPATDFFIIEGIEKESTISIYDINGKLVLNLDNFSGGKIDVSNLTSSTYLILIKNQDGAKIIKLLKK
jgi:hypothetical protein